MASEVIAFPVNLRKNKNQYNPSYGKYFPEADTKDPLNLKGFARHLSEHGKLASYEMLVLVLQNIVDCMRHLLLEGVPIKLEGLGTFRAGIEGTGADSIAEYRTDQNIKGIRINFMPEGAGDEADKLTKKVLLKQAVFQMNDYVQVHYKTVDGKEVSYQERTPIDQIKIKNAEPDPEP